MSVQVEVVQVSDSQPEDRCELDGRLERELLHTLINAVPDGLFLKDTKSRFILGNRAVAEIMGLDDPSELEGKTDHDFYPREVADGFLADERAVLENNAPLVDKFEPQHRGGVERWLSVTKNARLSTRPGQLSASWGSAGT